MKKLIVTALAAVMGVTGFGVGATTATAAPFVPLVQAPQDSNVIQVQGGGFFGGEETPPFLRRKYRQRFVQPGPGFVEPAYRPRQGYYVGGEQGPRQGFYQRGGEGWYNGHRGSRVYRQGYRRHGDWWFPAGAFIAGAIIGGALAAPAPDYYQPRPVRRAYRSNNYGSAHVQWCYNRYRSYDAYSNTFQPYHGPRQICYSPYS